MTGEGSVAVGCPGSAYTWGAMSTLDRPWTTLKELAVKIEAAQGPVIATMSAWLKASGKNIPSGGAMDGMNHGAGGMPGMMSTDDMALLYSASGANTALMTDLLKS